MKDLIRHILSEDSEGDSLSISELNKVWRLFDKIGVTRSLEHLDFDEDVLVDVVVGYYREHKNPKDNPEIEIIYDASDISRLFNSDMVSIVENYLEGNGDMESMYESYCPDYDHDWMWGDMDVENQSIILELAKATKIDFDINHPEDRQNYDLIEFIVTEFGSEIGCAFGDAQRDADIHELGKDIEIAIEDFFSEIGAKWSWGDNRLIGRVSVEKLSESDEFEEAVSYELEFGSNINWDDVEHKVMEAEFEWAGERNVFFSNQMYIDEDKHFRYGGAGSMNKEYMNELLHDRLENNY